MQPASSPGSVIGPAASVPLVLTVGAQTWRVTPERAWSIGRAPDNDVCLHDGRVSGRHATLAPTPDGWVLVNHSSNRMFVEGRKVEHLPVRQEITVSLGAPEGIAVHLQPESALPPEAATQVIALRPALPVPSSPADWYPDPAGSGRLRYFTGTEWSEHYVEPISPYPRGPAVYHPAAPVGQGPYQGGAPIYQIRLRKHTGLLILMLRQSYLFTGTFEQCQKAYRNAQLHNLLAGWWGLLSALVFNWIAIFSNVSSMNQLRRSVHRPAAAQTPEGWHPDPSGAPVQRYWDGTTWTQHTHPY